MITRDITKELIFLGQQYLTVTVIGPRQSGKTTLVKKTFQHKPYINLEIPDIRQLATEDPRRFLSQYPNGAILDEIQRVPQLLSYIQAIVDEKQQKGQFILTGSHQLQLHESISQSLAGRTALLKLLPLSINELNSVGVNYSLDEYLLNGFFPRIYNDKIDPSRAYQNYLQTYVEKDIRQLINLKDLNLFERFLRLLAGRAGQQLNLSSLANDVGTTVPTIKSWLSILEASFIIFRLEPYYEKFNKRITKTPKIYFSDVGFLTQLLGINSTKELARDPLRGHIVENLVVLELFKYRYNLGLPANLYYYRDKQHNEVDVLFKSGNNLIPIKIKSSQTYHSDFLKGLRFFKKLVGDKMPKGFLIYDGPHENEIEQFHILNFSHATKALQQDN